MTPVREAAVRAKAASRVLATLDVAARDGVLRALCCGLATAADELLAANASDVAAGEVAVERGELAAATLARLRLTEAKLAEMQAQVASVERLPDPLGKVLAATELDQGLELEKRTVPLGVLAVIFEARPDAVTQIAALALKSGNAVLLKAGREVEATAVALVQVIRATLAECGLPEDAVTLVRGREQVAELLGYADLIDLVIPRGSKALVEYVQGATRIPVLGHAEGVCHIFVDETAREDLVLRVVEDAKCSYPAACNAVETVLVHEALAGTLLPRLVDHLRGRGVRVLGLEGEPVLDWGTEYGEKTLAVAVVSGLDAAIEHIHRHGSSHTEAILTENVANAERFVNVVDAAGVFVNASTRFADGFRYGFGAEVGVSTSKFHARGPVGLDGLTTYKYVLRGQGQVTTEYGGAGRQFLHRRH